MNINSINHSMPIIQNDSLKMTEQLTKEPKRFHESQQSTSHKGIVVNRTNVKSTVEKLNEFNTPERTNLKFVYHEDLHEYYVTVVNPLTHEVIREIPPKKMLDMFAAMTEYMGILVDEKA